MLNKTGRFGVVGIFLACVGAEGPVAAFRVVTTERVAVAAVRRGRLAFGRGEAGLGALGISNLPDVSAGKLRGVQLHVSRTQGNRRSSEDRQGRDSQARRRSARPAASGNSLEGGRTTRSGS